MKTLFTALLSLVPLFAAARQRSLSDDFDLGSRVGYCVAAGCQVFQGFELSEAPTPDRRIIVQVDKVLFGPKAEDSRVGVPFEDFENGNGQDSGGELSSVWSRVKLSRNLPLVVVLGLKGGFAVRKGEPVVVTSDAEEVTIIGSLSSVARQLDESGETVAMEVESLTQTARPSLAGFLFVQLVFSKLSLPRDVRSRLLGKMLDNRSVPEERAVDIANWLRSGYSSLSSHGRAELVSRLAEVSVQSNSLVAAATYDALGGVMEIDNMAKLTLSPIQLGTLKSDYLMRLKAQGFSRNKRLEGALGIHFE